MTYQEEEQSGGKKMRMRKVARPVRKPVRGVRGVAMAKPKKAPARQRVFHKKLMKHFGGFFSELEGFAEQMSKVEHLTPGAAKKTAAAAAATANFANPPAMPKTPMPPAQEGGVYKKKRRPVAKRGPVAKNGQVRRQSRFGGSGLDEEFIDLDLTSAMNAVDRVANPVAQGMTTTAQTLGLTSGGARPRVRRASSPSYRVVPVVRRARRPASPRRK